MEENGREEEKGEEKEQGRGKMRKPKKASEALRRWPSTDKTHTKVG